MIAGEVGEGGGWAPNEMTATKGGPLRHTTSSAIPVVKYWKNSQHCFLAWNILDSLSSDFFFILVYFCFAPGLMNIVLSTCTRENPRKYEML